MAKASSMMPASFVSLSKVMKFTEKQPNIYIFQRYLAKTRESLGLVNTHIRTGQRFNVCSRHFVYLMF